MPGFSEIMIIVILLIVIFGASSIPKIARSLGKAKSEFEKGVNEEKKDKDKKDEN